MEGPRAVRIEEWESLRALTSVVFRPTLLDEYPHLFNIDNCDNLRVCVDAGRVVSHVGMKQQDALLAGCRIRTACIGAVSTAPEYRKQGLASACFDDAVEKAVQDGVDLMLVSGNRNLYRMRGCVVVGSDLTFRWNRETVIADRSALLPSITVEPMRENELDAVMACYRSEGVRFLRTPDDYRYALQSGMVMNRFGQFQIVRENGDFRGYFYLHAPDSEGRAGIAEFAGERRALLSAIAGLLEANHLTELRWQVLRHDSLFRSLCEQSGLVGEQVATPGTVKLIRFEALMQRLRPYFEERLGIREADGLRFAQVGDRYLFGDADQTLLTDRDTATRLLFGTLSGGERPASSESDRPGRLSVISGHGRLTEICEQVFPLPCLWYGLNYV